MNEFHVSFHEETESFPAKFIEAKLKPEQQKSATPSKEQQPVTPDEGFVLSEVVVEPIPDEYIIPAGTKNIISNGNHNVYDYAEAEVAVPPPILQQKTATPTEQQQTVEADSGYDALSRVTVEPIPDEYIVPAGKVTLIENATDVDVSQYEKADIVVPVPVMPEEYAVGGSLADNTATGYYCKRGITTIIGKSFRYFTNLETVDMPDSVQIIKETAFYYLTKLRLSKLPANLTKIENDVFTNCYAILLNGLPPLLSEIGARAFQNCRAINFDSIPDGVTVLNTGVFAQCVSLELKSLPRYVTTIANASFSGSTKLLISKIPSTVVSIGQNAFYQNYGITSITFNGTPTTIDATAFNQCVNLLNIYVPWSEGEVANTPWGATNATIHYNYTGGGE